MSRRKKNIGDWGEKQACKFLERHGFRVVNQNFFTTVGEIDIVATKSGDYYFIEVKTRAKGSLATDMAITKTKQKRLSQAAKKFCYQYKIEDFSVILAGLIISVDKREKTINCRFCILY